MFNSWIMNGYPTYHGMIIQILPEVQTLSPDSGRPADDVQGIPELHMSNTEWANCLERRINGKQA